MSIGTDVTRIKSNITAALAAIADKGVTVPDGSTSDALAELIASIEAGGGNIAYSEVTMLNPLDSLNFPCTSTPNLFVCIGAISNSNANYVGFAFHIEKNDGTIYQEKRRYQSTNYITGKSVTDGSLFTFSKNNEYNYKVTINKVDTSYGTLFSTAAYKVIAARI